MFGWLLLLTGCWEPTETSTSAMVGRLLDHTGFPIADVAVGTLEARVITGADGHFAVQYQAPNTHVDFAIGATHYRRTYREVDMGANLDVAIGQLRDVTIQCEAECNGRVSWVFADGLSARASVSCAPGATAVLLGVPADPPALECRTGEGVLTEEGAVWRVRPTSRQVRVTVEGGDDCRISVGGILAHPDGEHFIASAQGEVVVRGACDGVPLLPVRTADDATVVASAGQTWDLGSDVPESVQLVGRPTLGPSWHLSLPVVDADVVTPVLPTGVYVFMGPDVLPTDAQISADETAALTVGALHRRGTGPRSRWVLRVGE